MAPPGPGDPAPGVRSGGPPRVCEGPGGALPHLHDRFLLFHLAGAAAWRLLRAGAMAGRSGREQRGVLISARVASSAGEGRGEEPGPAHPHPGVPSSPRAVPRLPHQVWGRSTRPRPPATGHDWDRAPVPPAFHVTHTRLPSEAWDRCLLSASPEDGLDKIDIPCQHLGSGCSRKALTSGFLES